MRIAYIMCVVSVFVGCNTLSRVEIDDSDAVVVKIEHIEEKPVDISDLVDSVEFVRLETAPESLIAEIEQVMFIDDMIVATDKKIDCMLFFDRGGKYLYKIHRKGRGPGEYLDITKTLWDERRRELLVWNLAARQLLFYTLDGTFIRSIDDFNNKNVIRDIMPTADGGYLCYREDKSKGSTEPDNLAGLWKVDSLGNFERFLFERTTIHPSISSQFLFNLYPLGNGETGLIDQYSADIYHTDGQNISKYLSFDLPRKRMEDFAGIDVIEEDEPYISLHHNTEKGDMVLTEWWFGPEGYYFISLYSKRDGSVRTGRNASVMVEGQLMPVFMNVPTNDPSVMASIISPLTILSILDSPDVPDGMKAILQKMVEGKDRDLIENMNPVLMLLHTKNN